MLSAKILEIVFVHLDACSLRNFLKYGYLDACSVRNLRRPPGASRWNPKLSLKSNYHSEHPLKRLIYQILLQYFPLYSTILKVR